MAPPTTSVTQIVATAPHLPNHVARRAQTARRAESGRLAAGRRAPPDVPDFAVLRAVELRVAAFDLFVGEGGALVFLLLRVPTDAGFERPGRRF